MTDWTRQRASVKFYRGLAHILPIQLAKPLPQKRSTKQDHRAARLLGCQPFGQQLNREAPSPTCGGKQTRELEIRYYALVFLIVGLVAGALGLVGVAGMASQIAWILFLIGVVLLVVQLVRRRTPPVT